MSKLKVMIVDDEVTIVEGFLRLFDWESNDFSIVGVEYDGLSAINLAREKHPDIVIIDINMPIKSGLEVVRTISEEMKHTAFIIVSGYNEYNYMREALQLQVTDYLLKPVKFDELAKVLDRVRMHFVAELPGKQERLADNYNQPQADKTINNMVSYINEHLSEDISLKQLADYFHMNPYYLSQFFKENTTMNYHSYLTLRRINLAKHLLSTTKMSIAEISSRAGFSDYRVFTKVFKKIEGVLPTRYRASIK